MFVSVVILRGVLFELRSLGVDTDRLIRACGLSEERLADFRAMVSIEDVCAGAEAAIELTGDPALALHIGAKAPEKMLQVLGHLLVSSRTSRESFNFFQRYSALVIEGSSWELLERDELAYFSFDPGLPVDQARFVVECALSMVHHVGSHFAQRPSQGPVEVWFRHAAPEYAAEYERVFNAPVRFGQASNTIVCNRAVLDVPQLHRDATMCLLFQDSAERLLAERASSTSLPDRVRAFLASEHDLAHVDTSGLARRLGLTPRALRRRLSTEGVPLSSLIDEARCRLACRDLRRPDSCIKQTAELLGFSEPSAFHRAFKRWTGLTPAQYRGEGSSLAFSHAS